MARNKIARHRRLCLLAATSSAAFCCIAHAQTASPAVSQVPAGNEAEPNDRTLPASPPATPTSNPDSTASTEDIVVTAQKREERINRVGLAITAVSGANLEKQGIRNIADLALVVPGLTFASTNTGTPVYTLRGIGFYESSLSAYPTVSVYVDQVPLPFPALTSAASLDLERVEVLKGPQGILFGQNSTGGAINYIARKPTDYFDAGGSLSVGRFKDIDGTAFISGPIASNLTARLVVRAEHADDWQYSYTRKDSLGETKKLIGRLLFDWDPIDRLKIELSFNGWIDKSDPQAAQYVGLALASGIPLTPNGKAIAAYPISPRNDRAADWSPDYRPKGNQRMGQVALRASFDLGSATLTSITAYNRYRRRDVSDQDGLALDALQFVRQDGDIKSFTQELRLASPASQPFRWLVGANYERSAVDEFFRQYYPGQSTVDLLKGLLASYGVDIARWNSNSFYSDQRLVNYAAFGNMEYDPSPEVTVKAGARYTNSLRDARACNIDDDQHGEAALFNSSLGCPVQAYRPSVTGAASCPTQRRKAWCR